MSGTIEQATGGAAPEVQRPTAGLTATDDRRNLSVDITLVGKRIRRLHDQVCGLGQRVEITRAGCDDVCVMISKRELEAMEAALAIHATSPAYVDLCHGLTRLLAEAGEVYRPDSLGGVDPVRTFADDCANGYA